jgi:RNA polymerase sigma-70 factor (ECF subfamily)
MPPADDFADLLARLRRGDEEAAGQLYTRYAGRLIALACSRLGGPVRRKLDPEDVVQSALNSFFQRQRRGQFELADWDSLWSLLVTITLRKCGHKVEYYRAACRDVGREEAPLGGGDSVRAFEALARDPSPSQAAALVELTEQILTSFRDPRERQIFLLALDGRRSEEIGHEVGLTQRTVQRVLARTRSRLERMRAG